MLHIGASARVRELAGPGPLLRSALTRASAPPSHLARGLLAPARRRVAEARGRRLVSHRLGDLRLGGRGLLGRGHKGAWRCWARAGPGVDVGSVVGGWLNLLASAVCLNVGTFPITNAT
jgi:hypothetical protein